MRHHKRSHRYTAKQELRAWTPEQTPAPVAPETPTPPPQAYANLPTLDLRYGFGRHMSDMNIERKWQVVGKDVVPRTHAPSVHERTAELNRYDALKNLAREELAKRKARRAKP